MPPQTVKTIRDLIYWEYAKLIAGSAVSNRRNYGFIMDSYKKLKGNKMHPSTILRENKRLVEQSNKCAYCTSTEDLHWEHIIPKSKGGSDTIDNMVQACQKCNLSKSDKDLYEWYGKERRYEVPRLVLGKYLKIVYEEHERNGTLESGDINGDGVLDVLDLGAAFK